MLPKYPYYCLQILILILSSATVQTVRKVWVEGKTALGTEEGQKKDAFTIPTKLKVICPRSRQYNLKTGRELTAKRYQHKCTLCPQYNYHLYPTPMFENPLRRETLRQLNGFLSVRINFLSMTEISAES